MPDKVKMELHGMIHYMGHLREASKRGMRAALATAPKCRFGMLERLDYSIQTYGSDGAIGVSELAHHVQQPLPAVSRGLRLLEQDGMVIRQTDPQDRRKTLVRLTPEGESALHQCEQVLNEYFNRVMARIDPAQLEQMLQMRNVLIDALEAETAAMQQAAHTKGEAADGQDL